MMLCASTAAHRGADRGEADEAPREPVRRILGYALRRDPILRSLDHIECRDAALQAHYEGVVIEDSEKEHDSLLVAAFEPEWPEADTIVGNPPFLGGSKKRGELGDEYFNALKRVYMDRVPAGADFVTYWFEKARAQVEGGKAHRVGLVATNSIRGGANRKVLERIVATAPIFEAWSDEPWINNGAAVRVSLVCFGDGMGTMLDGKPVAEIHADLTAGSGITQAKPLDENVGVSFQGSQKIGPFDIPGELARQWLASPNPNCKPNTDVLKPSWNGIDLTRRPRDTWIIDFGPTASENEAALYETPFGYTSEHVKPERITNPRAARAKYWWRHGDPQPAMRAALAGLTRYIATSEVSKHRVFVWMNSKVLPDKKLIVIARSDDATFGIIHSRFHELWSLAVCSWHGVGNDPRYTPSTTFETFPFPDGLTPRDTPAGPHADAIATVAKKLNERRENWLNPPEWVEWVRTPEEEQAGFPLRPVAKPGHEADLKKRTLTNLYNSRPAWLDHAHRELDAAVAAAYGWRDYTSAMPDDEILKRLLAMNLDRAAKQGATKQKATARTPVAAGVVPA